MIPAKMIQELIDNSLRMERKLDELTARLDSSLKRLDELTPVEGEGLMTDRDLNHILAQDDIIAGIDAWNESRGHRRGKRRAA